MSDPQQSLGNYYPSFVVNLKIRFDEALHVVSSKADTAGSATQSNPTPSAGQPPAQEPLIIKRGTDNMTHLMNIVPSVASVEMTGIRQAWKFNLTFDFKDLPIDPRLVRAIAVELHLGTVTPAGFADGMRAADQYAARLDKPQVPSSVLPTRRNGVVNRDTLLFYGVVDSWTVEHGDAGSTVQLEGRDLRGLLLDVKVPIAKIAALDIRKPISKVVAAIIGTLPVDDDIRIEVVSDFPLLTREPTPGDADDLTRVRRGAKGEGKSAKANEKTTSKVKMTPQGTDHGGGDNISYWDLITQYCFLVGSVPYWDGTRIVIRPARDIFDQVEGPNAAQSAVNSLTQLLGGKDRFATPFANGKPRVVSLGDGVTEELRIRRLVYGRDIKGIKYERKYNTQAVPIVKVVTVDDSKRGKEKLVEVQWPPKGTLAAEVKGEDSVIKIPAPGIKNKDVLLAIAHDTYEEIGRGEIGGSCTTTKLSSFGGDASDPDLLRLKPTDAIEFLVDTRSLSPTAPLVSELVDQHRRSFDEQVSSLTGRLKDENLARVLAATARGVIVESLRYFRVNNVKFDWKAEDGVEVSFDFHNYVVARHNEAFVRNPNAVATTVRIDKAGAHKKTMPDSVRQSAKKPSAPTKKASKGNPILPGAGGTASLTVAQTRAGARQLGLPEAAIKVMLGSNKAGEDA